MVRAQVAGVYPVADQITLFKNEKDQLFLANQNTNYPKWINITEDMVPIAENVKEVYLQYNNYYEYYYLTNDNKLYASHCDESNYILVAENVKKIFNDQFNCYLTKDNEIYIINDPYDINDNILLVENGKDVKEFYGDVYLTNENKIYAIDYDSDKPKYSLVAENIKKFYGEHYCYLTNENELYIVGQGKPLAKILSEVYSATYGYKRSIYYISNENKLYILDSEKGTSTFIAENIKKCFEKCYMNGNGQYVEFYYLTNDNKLYDFDAYSSSLIAENVEEVSNYYYKTSDGVEYIYIGRSIPI